MIIYLVVGAAGGVGALLRYSISTSTSNLWFASFPLGTLLANLIGCFMLGWFTTRIIKRNRLSKQLAAGIGTGLIGSFTTFSTFSMETVILLEDNLFGLAFLYMLTSLVGGLVLAWCGYQIGARGGRGI